MKLLIFPTLRGKLAASPLSPIFDAGAKAPAIMLLR
ncbi:hypothetical protein X736_08875 [Mesorhizobium sp. L2C089B000]|nr:hypothetical protein X736_08875 [Mesorhizobium sp. L2C089B000]